MSETGQASGFTTAATYSVVGCVRIECPSGWGVKESFTLVAPDGKANIIASSEPLDPSIDIATYAGVQGKMLEQEFNGYQQISLEEVGVVGAIGPAQIREFTWTPPDGVQVSQIQLYAVTEARGVTATVTATSNDIDRYLEIMLHVLESISISEDAAHHLAQAVRP